MIAFFFWYGVVCAGCVVVLVASVLLTLAEGCVRQRLANRRRARSIYRLADRIDAHTREWPAHDAEQARARQRAELRQRQAADLEEWRRELGWTKR